MQPGTIEAYQHAIDLDPNGQIGAQAKQGLSDLQAMGVGITTKVGQAPPSRRKKASRKLYRFAPLIGLLNASR